MGILRAVRDRFTKDKQARTRAAIHAALTETYERAPAREAVSGRDRYVVFSDHHKGGRDGADDFQRSERAYNAALAYYDAMGYHLVELGDVEELWENTFEEIAEHYPRTLALAAAFLPARYTRIFGNHDIAWKDTGLFQAKMGRFGYGDVEPIEALRLVVNDAAGQPIVELLLAHGHQGTASSDRYAWLSKLFVRFGWRRLQRLINRPWNSPSMDWKLRGEHAADMESWAAAEGRVLIAGHTHMPVFFGGRKQPAEPASLTSGASDAPDAAALRLARSQWAAAEQARLEHEPPIDLKTPCYFNTGCCSYGDGDITGLEIRDGEIMLVRWPCDPETKPEILERMALADVAGG